MGVLNAHRESMDGDMYAFNKDDIVKMSISLAQRKDTGK